MAEDRPTSVSSNSPNSSPVIELTREDALNLLGITEIPGGEANFGVLMNGTEYLVNRYGEEWVRKNRVRLVEELEMLAEM